MSNPEKTWSTWNLVGGAYLLLIMMLTIYIKLSHGEIGHLRWMISLNGGDWQGQEVISKWKYCWSLEMVDCCKENLQASTSYLCLCAHLKIAHIQDMKILVLPELCNLPKFLMPIQLRGHHTSFSNCFPWNKWVWNTSKNLWKLERTSR